MTLLRGPRLALRPVTRADLSTLLAILREPAVAEHWSQPDDDFDEHELMAGDATDEECATTFAVTIDERIIGWIAGWEKLHRDYRHAGIDLFLTGDEQGKGYGPEAIRAVCRWLFDVRGHHRITIDPAADNLRAIAAYERVGFRRVGVMRRYERGADGTYHDGLLLDLLPDDLQEGV
jgi:aminoglycoside 6'-N-acetyltransferase